MCSKKWITDIYEYFYDAVIIKKRLVEKEVMVFWLEIVFYLKIKYI